MTNEEILQYVASSIKAIRHAKRLSQLELSVRANMSQSFLANIETGKKEPSTMTLIRLARALEVSPKDFFPAHQGDSSFDIKEDIKGEIRRLLAQL